MRAPLLTYLVIFWCVISLVSIFVTIADKRRAKQRKWRISEAALLTLSALGGSAAMYLTMLLIRHKTKHARFMLGIPLILLCQGIVLLWAFGRYGVR